MSKLNSNHISQSVISFLQNQGAEHLVDEWLNSSENTKIKKLCKSTTTSAKDPNFPKRGISAYIFFYKDESPIIKQECPHLTKTKDITKEVGIRWRSLDPQRKAHYETLAQQDRERYEQEKANYVPYEGSVEAIKKKKKEKTGPKKPATAYLLFCQENRPSVKENNPSFSAKEVMTELGKLWKQLPQDSDERSRFKLLAQLEKEKYEQEKAQLNNSYTSVPKRKKNTSKEESKIQPNTGFEIFTEEYKPQIKELYPNITSKSLAKEIKKLWKNLSDEEKEEYEEKALE